jgi:hypothetical protein
MHNTIVLYAILHDCETQIRSEENVGWEQSHEKVILIPRGCSNQVMEKFL